MDPELLPGSGSGIFVPDPDLVKNESRFHSQFRPVNSGLCVLSVGL